MKNTKIIILAVVAILFIVAMLYYTTTIPKITSREIQDKSIDSLKNIKTQKMDMHMDMDMNMTIDSEFTANDEDYNAPTKLNVVSNSISLIDTENKKMKFDMTINYVPKEVEDDPGPKVTMSMKSVMYIIDDMVYTNTQIDEKDFWIKQLNKDIWKQYDQTEQQKKMLEVMESTRLNDAKVDGKSCYVIEMDIDMEQFWEVALDTPYINQMMKQQGSNQFNMDGLKDMVKDMNIIQYISKDNFYVMKQDVNMSIFMSIKKVVINMDMHIIIKQYDYNKPVKIELPVEAQNAKDISELTMEEIFGVATQDTNKEIAQQGIMVGA